MPLPMVLATAVPEQKRGEKVECGGPNYGQARRENAGGDYGRDAVGRIVKAVQEIEDQRGDDGDDEQDHSCAHERTILELDLGWNARRSASSVL